MSLKLTKSHAPRLFAARTDVGSVREHNEDSFLVKSPLFVVADGMGGHEAGEIASKLAVDTMSEKGPKSTSPDAMGEAIVQANYAVLRGAKDGTGKPGMGTTLVAAFFYDDDMTIGWVGDSRAYLLHDKKLQRITRDHSLVADLIEQGRLTEIEARFHPQRSVITRALGSDPHMQPSVTKTLKVVDGDRVILCSDGLSSMVSDDVIEAILIENSEPSQACDALVDEAIAAGGLDNVTVIVIDPLGKTEEDLDDGIVVEQLVSDIPSDQIKKSGKRSSLGSAGSQAQTSAPSTKSDTSAKNASRSKKGAKHSKPKQRSKMAPLIWTLIFVVILAAAAIGFFSYAQNSYYIIAENGIVNVYRGLPGSFAGISFSWLEAQAPDVSVNKLTPTTQSRLNSGISVNSLEEANNLIAEYRQSSNRG